MIIERSGIRLVRLTEEFIELVRQKRNLPEIQKTMEYREHITPEMQQKWFATINNANNYYFLIETHNIFIGLISAAVVDWEKDVVNNAGIFIWNETYLSSPEIMQASVLLTDFSYYIGMKKIYIRILKDNSKAIAFNISLGYKLLSDQDDVYNQKYELETPDIYFNATEKIRHQAGINGNIKVFVSQQEYMEFTKYIRLQDNKYITNITFDVSA